MEIKVTGFFFRVLLLLSRYSIVGFFGLSPAASLRMFIGNAGLVLAVTSG